MSTYSLSHLSDPVLLRDLAALVARDHATTAALLAHLAEVDARRLYVPAGYPSMRAYLVGEFHLSEEGATKRIGVARAARRVPAIFEAVAAGRLHLTAVVLLGPHLSPENADELLEAATHKTTFEIKRLIAEWFPRLAAPTQIRPIDPAGAGLQQDSNPVQAPGPMGGGQQDSNPAPGLMGSRQQDSNPVDGRPASQVEQRARVEPLAPQWYELNATISQEMLDKLHYAQALLGHRVASGDVPKVLERALDALIHELEKRKFAATRNPRRSRGRSTNKRHVPAAVKHSVWERDQGRCTFVSATGRRCAARHALEFDHIDPVARGGQASTDRIRLRCRAHNQYEAERVFGTAFMDAKRQEARRAREEARRMAPKSRVAVEAGTRAAAAERAQERDVVPWLRQLGFNARESRDAAAFCEGIPDAALEERVRVALSFFHPRTACLRRAGNAGAPRGRRAADGRWLYNTLPGVPGCLANPVPAG